MKWLQWLLLTALTGNPILAAALVLVGWWLLDRFTFRFLPNPFGALRRLLKISELRRQLSVNPHDRKARYSLAELMVERGKYAAAVELLRPNLEAGDEDVPTLFLMGVACLGAGHADQGELLLQEAQAEDATFRLGAIELERGRYRLRRGDVAGAKQALQNFLVARKGTVEGRVLLAAAYEKGGDAVEAKRLRDEAWREYASSPRFLRRVDRFWAWRAQPWRPAMYAAIAILVGFVFSQTVAPTVRAQAQELTAHDKP